jgi:hypothetical protein
MMFDQGEPNSQNLLMAYTDARLHDSSQDLSSFLATHDIDAMSPLGRLLQLADYLHRMLPQHKPSPEFVQALYDELVGVEGATDSDWFSQFQFERQLERQLERWRHLPRHMQFAAGLTFTAGLFWVASRVRRENLLSGENDEDNLEQSA